METIINDVKYKLNEDYTAEVIRLGEHLCYNGDVVILPQIILNGISYVVSSIGNRAFATSSSLKSVSLPSTITIIGQAAFSHCAALSNIIIPISVTQIAEDTFSDCSSLVQISIPNSVTSIGSGAFAGCSSLTQINIPNSVTSIGSRTFSGCSSLAPVNIPNSVTSIGSGAFAGCSSLTQINIPNSVTNIGSEAFFCCSSLAQINIPNSVTSIGSRTFSGCSSLIEIIIPSSTIGIGEGIFYGCSKLHSIKVLDGNPLYDCRNNCNAIIETRTNTLIAGCQNTVIPNNINTIKESAFGNIPINSIRIPKSVRRIKEGAFSSCSDIVSIIVEEGNLHYDSRDNCNAIIETDTNTVIVGCQNTILPNSITIVGNHAFSGCSSLESIIIPKGVISIGQSAFSGCTSLTSILLSDTIKTISAYAFWSCSSLSSIVIPNSVKTIEEGTFDYCYALSYIIIPNSVTCIKDGFYHCKSLSSIIIPASVEKIKAPLFMHCSSLISINVERGNIHYDSRDNCNAIIETKTNTLIAGCQNTVIPQSVVNIGFKAFAFRNTLKSIIIPRNITCIQESAFESCSSISSIVVEDDNNYYDSRNNCNAIIETATNKLILGCQNTIIPNTVKTIGYQAFYNCSFLTSIIIPDGVVSIEKEAFCNCHSLEAITIPKTLNSIGYGVLQNSCTIDKITNYSFIDIQKYATALGLADFEINGLLIRRDGVVGCKKNIKSVNIPDGIRQVSSNAFINCTALESITFPNSINDCCLIDLDSCTSLKEISIPKGKRAKFLEIGLEKYNDKIVESNDEEVSILLNIAKGYELGIGMAKNLAQAVLIYNQAAEKGCAEAAYHLGELYEKGEGLPQDYQRAVDWYTKAVSLSHPSAEERKKRCEQILQEDSRD